MKTISKKMVEALQTQNFEEEENNPFLTRLKPFLGLAQLSKIFQNLSCGRCEKASLQTPALTSASLLITICGGSSIGT